MFFREFLTRCQKVSQFQKPYPNVGRDPHSLRANHGHQAFRKPGPRPQCRQASGFRLALPLADPQLPPASAPGTQDYKGRSESSATRAYVPLTMGSSQHREER